MPDREKVIKGLECCLHGPMQCEKCPYMSEIGETVPNCVKTMRTDAISLLKEQEPRVMKLQEVHEMSWDYCYLEEEVIKDKVLRIYSGKYRIKCITWPSIASCVLSFGDEAYGKRWRCWTSRPTDEQRKATPWEPPKEG